MNESKKDRIDGRRVETRAKFKTTCRVCKNKVYEGDTVFYFPLTKCVEHYNCTRHRRKT